MVFSDLFFLFVFLPLFACCYLLGALLDRRVLSRKGEADVFHARNSVLVVFSLLFYAWGEPVYVFLMLVSVLVNWLVGRRLTAVRHPKLLLAVGIAFNIAIIGTFKYLGFFAEILNDLGLRVGAPNIALPIGISFYTFQSISYLVDVYRRESPAQRRYRDLLLYISMFPQLIAGPIVRYGTIAENINNRRVQASDMAEGMFRFAIGLGKKVIIANQLSSISDQMLAGSFDTLTTTGSWVGLLAFTLQIYFDFSGYSDMAIGMGRCLGFRFNENFNHPYCCDSVTDFWRRWHISLGSFFRDYVYIPMGGNRRHQPINILVVWFLTGMWHGACWNFIIWGLYFGLIIMIEKYTVLRIKRFIPSLLLHIYSLLIVITGWGIFYFTDFGRMTDFFGIYFGATGTFHDFLTFSILSDHFYLWLLALLFCLPLRQWTNTLTLKLTHGPSTTYHNLVLLSRLAVTVVVFALSIVLLVGATNNPFLYTRF